MSLQPVPNLKPFSAKESPRTPPGPPLFRGRYLLSSLYTGQYDWNCLLNDLIGKLQGASKVIVVDAVRGGEAPGTIHKYTFTPRKGNLSELPSLHSLKLSDILDLAMSSGILTCPVVIIGVEPKDNSLGIGLSPDVESALPKVIEAVIKELR